MVTEADDGDVRSGHLTPKAKKALAVGRKPETLKKIVGRILEAQHAVLLSVVEKCGAAEGELGEMNNEVRSMLDRYWSLK